MRTEPIAPKREKEERERGRESARESARERESERESARARARETSWPSRRCAKTGPPRGESWCKSLGFLGLEFGPSGFRVQHLRSPSCRPTSRGATPGPANLNQKPPFEDLGNFWRQMPTKWLQERPWDRVRRAWRGTPPPPALPPTFRERILIELTTSDCDP